MPDIGTFLLTWLSYFIWIVFGLYVFFCIMMKQVLTLPKFFYAIRFMGGSFVFILIVIATTILAFVSKYDPLAWLWNWIASWFG